VGTGFIIIEVFRRPVPSLFQPHVRQVIFNVQVEGGQQQATFLAARRLRAVSFWLFMLHADHTLSDARMTGGFEALKKQRSGLARALCARTFHSTWCEVSTLLHLGRQSTQGSGGCPGGWPKAAVLVDTLPALSPAFEMNPGA
jgi:hypothetical protein